MYLEATLHLEAGQAITQMPNDSGTLPVLLRA